MPLDQEAITQQQEQLAVHRRRLEHLFQQQAILGAYTPPYIVLDIEQTQAAVRDIKALLREHSVPVEDHPDDDRSVQVAAPLPPALHQLRAPVGDFVGREREIEQLVAALQKSGGAAISGVRGMGGIGKSELAYKVADKLVSTFPDAQLVVSLRGASTSPLSPEQVLQMVIRTFEREVKLPDDLDTLRTLYASALAGKRAFILADDAEDAAQVRPLLPPAGCALLVTSRNRFSLPGMTMIDLGMLPKDDAQKLLLEICPRIGEHARELAKLCGHLPLALRVSASLLANSSRSVARYLEQLAVERLKHLSDPDDPQASVEASLRLSYDALEPTVQAALGQMSVFPTNFDQAAALAVVQVERDAETILDLLQRRSLLEWDDAAQRYSLHDLVRAFAAARLEDADAVRLRHARHYAQVADRANTFYLEGGAATLTGLALFDRERIHIDAGWGWARERAGEQDADALLLDYASATAYVGNLRYDNRRERIPQLEAALAATRRRGRKDAEGVLLGNLGNAYVFLGKARQALTFYEQALVIARELGDQRWQGIALGGLGNAYVFLGEARQALTFDEQHLEIARELGDRDNEGAALGNLGNAYYVLGDARKTITFHEQHLEVARELGDRREEGAALNNLSLAYRVLGELQRAMSFGEQALTINRAIGHRYGECIALNNLSQIAMVSGDPQRALDLGEQALAIACSIGDLSRESETRHNLGAANAAAENIQRAIEHYEQALAIRREIGNRDGEARTSKALAHLIEEQGNLARAAELMQVCVDFEREIGHPDAEADTAYLEQLRQQLAGGDGVPVAGEGEAAATSDAGKDGDD
jgi:tetratricopeptide (TPR) repeat protein